MESQSTREDKSLTRTSALLTLFIFWAPDCKFYQVEDPDIPIVPVDSRRANVHLHPACRRGRSKHPVPTISSHDKSHWWKNANQISDGNYRSTKSESVPHVHLRCSPAPRSMSLEWEPEILRNPQSCFSNETSCKCSNFGWPKSH